ncbi:protease modulator HflC [Parvularcula sp. LCG005]|uniref:protease modulator HflC n=1 Tax=Parvularcula sp. LCG005 TaxID=3078805 RepID=UPI0029425722|nr:protease modulator HflC [Parvularcula sp. LCG005]WOI52279.1 protease modulator HflC [Parvularcula sp. LCG005]
MNPFMRFIAIVVVGGALIFAGSIFFTVKQWQQAIVLEFGAPKGGAINEPGSDEAGLQMKLPWQNVIYLDARNLDFDLPSSLEIVVANEERLLVDAFVRYQITDPLLYYQSLGAASSNANEIRAQFNNRLTNILSEAMRGQLGSKTIRLIINEQRAQIMAAIKADVTEEARKLGVTIIDVRIRQADFPDANADNVYRRMVSDYNQQAERIRAEGQRRAQEIRAEADKEVVRILAVAEERSQIIRGRADAIRNCIFANAYQGVPARIADTPPSDAPIADAGENGTSLTDAQIAAILGVTCQSTSTGPVRDASRQEFFDFYRSLEAYQTALKTGDTMVLSPNSEFFRYFNGEGGAR